MRKKKPKPNCKKCNYVKQNGNKRNKKRKVDRSKGTEVKDHSYIIQNINNNITNNFYSDEKKDNKKKLESDFIKAVIVGIITIVGSIAAIVEYLLGKR